MHVLSRLPTDGTFHQTQPLDRIVNWKAYYSSDFTAATDRMPLRVLFHVMEHLFGSSFASACVNSTLATNTFDVPFVKHPEEINGKFRCGSTIRVFVFLALVRPGPSLYCVGCGRTGLPR